MTSTQQRAELQRRIWQIANDVRGAVDGWDFKQYTPEIKNDAQLKTTVSRIDQLRKDIDAIVSNPPYSVKWIGSEDLSP